MVETCAILATGSDSDGPYPSRLVKDDPSLRWRLSTICFSLGVGSNRAASLTSTLKTSKGAEETSASASKRCDSSPDGNGVTFHWPNKQSTYICILK